MIWNGCGTGSSASARFDLVGSDFDRNGGVDDADFLALSAAYDRMLCTAAGIPASCQADLNADGVVDDSYFVIFVVAYERFFAN